MDVRGIEGLGRRAGRRAGAAMLAAWLAACGGGSDGGGAATPAETVARVEIVEPGAVVGPGGTAAFTARVTDASGQGLGTPVTWALSKTTASVDAHGVVTGGAAAGSALLTASAGGVSSAPAMVLVAKLAAGARVVADGEVVGDMAPVDALQTGWVGSRFKATLSGATPSAGQILVAGGSKGVSGRVVSTTAVAGGNEVVFETVGLDALFEQLVIDEQIDGAALAAANTHGAPKASRTNSDGRFEEDFVAAIPAGTPALAAARTGAAATRRGTQRAQPQALKKEFELGPFECETDVGAISVDASQIDVTLERDLQFVAQVDIEDHTVRHMKLAVLGGLGVKAAGPLELRAQMQGELECKLELVKFRIPVPPQVAAIVVPSVPIGFKFELEGALQAPALTIDLSGRVYQPIVVGVEALEDGTLSNLSSFGGPTATILSADADIRKPSVDDFVLKLGLEGGSYAELSVENPFVSFIASAFDKEADFALLECTFGPKYEGEWHTVNAQVGDTDDASRFQLSLHSGIGVSDDIFSVLKYIGVTVNPVDLSIDGELLLGHSPTGLAHSTLTSFVQGDQLIFRLDLDEQNLKIGVGPLVVEDYMVKAVQIWRRNDDGHAVLLAEQEAAPGAKSVSMTWTADRDDATALRYYAMVVPKKMSAFPLLVSETIGWRGMREEGGVNDDGYDTLVVDPQTRKVYAVGHTLDSIRLSDGTVVAKPGGMDVIVNEYSPDGGIARVAMFGSASDEAPFKAVLGPDGALYIAGVSVGGDAIDGTSRVSVMNAFVMKIDLRSDAKRMTMAWARQFGDLYERGTGLDIGPNGEIYLASQQGNPSWLGGTALTFECADLLARGGQDCGDVLLTRLDAAGNTVWRLANPQPGAQISPRVTAGLDGSVWLSGQSYCNVHTQAATCESNKFRNPATQQDEYKGMQALWRYDASGLGGPVNTIRIDDAVTGKASLVLPCTVWTANGLLLAGTTTGSFDGHATPGGIDVLLMQVDSRGQPSWTRMFGTAGDDRATGSCLSAKADGSGVYLGMGAAGALEGTWNGGIDAVLYSLDNAGTPIWGVQWGGSGDETPFGVGSDGAGGIFVAGRATGKVAPNLAFGGMTDAFLTKVSTSAQIQQAPRRSAASTADRRMAHTTGSLRHVR